jgi:cyclase
VSSAVTVPVIASGGFGEPQLLAAVVREGAADAVAVADALHYRRTTIGELRRHADAAGIEVRAP